MTIERPVSQPGRPQNSPRVTCLARLGGLDALRQSVIISEETTDSGFLIPVMPFAAQ